jgi:hypothetical protein
MRVAAASVARRRSEHGAVARQDRHQPFAGCAASRRGAIVGSRAFTSSATSQRGRSSPTDPDLAGGRVQLEPQPGSYARPMPATAPARRRHPVGGRGKQPELSASPAGYGGHGNALHAADGVARASAVAAAGAHLLCGESILSMPNLASSCSERCSRVSMKRPRQEGIAMPLRRICKSGTSGDDDDCPAIYLEEQPATSVAQGPLLSPDDMTELQQVGEGEGAVRLPTETLLRAAALILAEHGRPAMLAEVQDFLAEWGATA